MHLQNQIRVKNRIISGAAGNYPCFPEDWTATAALTIIDSLSFRVRKVVYCK